MRYGLSILFCLIVPALALALEPMDDKGLNTVSGQAGVSIVLEGFQITSHTELTAIGGEDGLGVPAVPEGAWFVMDSTRINMLDVEDGRIDFDAFTAGAAGMDLGRHGDSLPGGTSGAVVTFGEMYFHVNMTDALITLKFANNRQGINGDGVTTFSDTVCRFALNGSTVTVKSDDAKMFIYAH